MVAGGHSASILPIEDDLLASIAAVTVEVPTPGGCSAVVVGVGLALTAAHCVPTIDPDGGFLEVSDDGSIALLGVLDDGDSTCKGEDYYTRGDRILAWPALTGAIGAETPCLLDDPA